MREWITGRNPVYEVLRARRRPIYRLRLAQGAEVKGRLAKIVRLASSGGIPVETTPRPQVDSLGENPQGVALQVGEYPYSDLPTLLEEARRRGEPPLLLVLDLIQNPQNLGILLRTAEAVGAHGVILPLARSVGVTPAVVHASAGASEHLHIARANLAQALERLKSAGVWVVGLDMAPDAQPPQALPLDAPLALVVGSEGEGMRPLVRRQCDFLLRLPMRGQVDSLNAAAAGSIALYLCLLARQARPGTSSAPLGEAPNG
ncbi:RNA methyltransferase [Thermanaerothrix daxensis]|uniref:RNA methyltransferase n=1 Tax=Thermanaerothrix daxensis TaxID=869279 RepID=A0A0P6Y309_9CHLR|nr:23S rRNA (guanosine(2251)-2'-O)-methyltransferase RlmB [Thermanaerothrix daxensis]KPL83712.1 RNA methyltransferase [Thermanaerothrix daxensis]